MKRNKIPELTEEQKKVVARITFYHNYQDKWGNKTASGETAKQGVTIAAHPDFKFGKKVSIPALKSIIGKSEFIVQDRGRDVTTKKASRGKNYVFDVYIQSNSRSQGDQMIRKYASRLGNYAEVHF